MQECILNQVFANCSKEEEISPLTTQMIAEAQKADDCLRPLGIPGTKKEEEEINCLNFR
jgi:hypothetical protein